MLLQVDGIGRGDEERLEAVLRALPGVFGVVVSPAECCAEVDFEDDEVDLDFVLARVRDAGFHVELSG